MKCVSCHRDKKRDKFSRKVRTHNNGRCYVYHTMRCLICLAKRKK